MGRVVRAAHGSSRTEAFTRHPQGSTTVSAATPSTGSDTAPDPSGPHAGHRIPCRHRAGTDDLAHLFSG
jgi:hypothetical protein